MPSGFSAAVKDIKLAILQARARAARMANVEALKLYFYVGGYVSKKTRTAKWGTGALDALSERLQVELPGLRGFSPASIKFMRLWYEAWSPYLEIHAEGLRQIRHSASDDSASASSTSPIRHLASDEFQGKDFTAFVSVGFTHHREILSKCETFDERLYYIHACAKENWTVIELERHIRADDYHHVGALPNNFAKTLSPMVLATKAVRSRPIRRSRTFRSLTRLWHRSSTASAR